MSGVIEESGAMTGKVGTVRFFKRNGKIYQRTAHNIRRKSAAEMRPSKDAMIARLLHTAATKMWNEVREVCQDKWEDKKPGSTDYTCFLSANGQNGVYLTKEEFRDYRVIVPLKVSSGSLKPIEHTLKGGQVVTSINLNGLSLTSETTIHDLTCALMSSENDFKENDTLSLIVVSQFETNGTPKCKANEYSVKLSRGDERKVAMFFPTEFWSQKGSFLATSSNLPECCFSFMHIRQLSKDKTLVSTQTLYNNNQTMIARFMSDEQFEKAAKSYGGMGGSWLNPKS